MYIFDSECVKCVCVCVHSQVLAKEGVVVNDVSGHIMYSMCVQASLSLTDPLTSSL